VQAGIIESAGAKDADISRYEGQAFGSWSYRFTMEIVARDVSSASRDLSIRRS
jgi:hypothetical protein